MLKKLASGFVLVSMPVASAFAAVPTEVTTALGDAKTDGLIIAGAVLVAIIALYAFKLMRRGL